MTNKIKAEIQLDDNLEYEKKYMQMLNQLLEMSSAHLAKRKDSLS